MSVILIIADQLIKAWAFTDLQAIGTIPLIQDVLHLTYSENRGAAFSILYGKTELLMIVNTILIVVLLYILLSKKLTHPLAVFSTTLIVSGGIGNMIDRLIREGSFVVDYIDFRLINFAIFNFADICVVCGVALLLFYMIFIEGKESKTTVKEGSENDD
ncbi:MAG: signal peptidase II [Oscillospiraceae bacterium]|nr:signal peptidase II [Oscillospiraceae bacterium]